MFVFVLRIAQAKRERVEFRLFEVAFGFPCARQTSSEETSSL